jgi:hypothetical protein
MNNEDRATFLGLSVTFLLWMALVVLIVIGGAGFTVWYNTHLAVPVANSERYAQTCNRSYLEGQKAKIENNLSAIANNNVEIARAQDQNLKTQLQAQQTQNANEIYNALDASQCSRPQIIQDMPELQSFFRDFPNR